MDDRRHLHASCTVGFLKELIEQEIRLLPKIEHIDEIVFEPLIAGFWDIKPVLRQARGREYIVGMIAT
jgi:hypothetical protein